MGKTQTQFELIPVHAVPENAVPLGCRIASVSYDASLARTRAMMFSAAGLEVFTFMDVAQAAKACRSGSYDLMVVGHSIPREESRALVLTVQKECETPVLVLERPGEPALREADYSCDPAEPAVLLATVGAILRRKLTQPTTARKKRVSHGKKEKVSKER